MGFFCDAVCSRNFRCTVLVNNTFQAEEVSSMVLDSCAIVLLDDAGDHILEFLVQLGQVSSSGHKLIIY